MVVVFQAIGPFLGESVSFSIFGIDYVGRPTDWKAVLLQAIFAFLSVTAFGLLFGANWGPLCGLICGFGGLILVSVGMGFGFAKGQLELRLELLFQIPFIVSMARIQNDWQTAALPAAAPSEEE